MAYLHTTKEQEEAVLQQTGYTKKQLEADLKHIKEWIKKQHHLPASSLKEKDGFLTYFLTGSKGKLDKAKAKLDAYYTIRSKSSLFLNRDPNETEYRACQKSVYFATSNNIFEEKLCRVFYCKYIDSNECHFDFLQFGRIVVNLSELLMRLDSIAVRMYIIIDVKGVTISQALKIKPIIIRDLLLIFHNVLPLRYAKIIFINAPFVVVNTMNHLILPFTSKKMKNRIYITSIGNEAIYEDIDKSFLSKDYGGNGLTIKELDELFKERILSDRMWYINELSEKCDESKRENITESSYFFGVLQSLKKLMTGQTSKKRENLN